MKRFLFIIILLSPMAAFADHGDVIEVELKKNCSLQKYIAIKNDFNEQWGKANGYLAEIANPVVSNNVTSVFWFGRTANSQAFGKAWDTWRDELANPKSVAARLSKRLEACSTILSRQGYDLY